MPNLGYILVYSLECLPTVLIFPLAVIFLECLPPHTHTHRKQFGALGSIDPSFIDNRHDFYLP